MVQDGNFKPSLDVVSVSPLRNFWGVLKGYKGIPGKDKQTGREYMSIEFEFTDVEVILSTEPYPFPVAQLRIGYSQSAQTRWGGFAKSIRRIAGPMSQIDDLPSKRQRWEMAPWAIRQPATDADGNPIIGGNGKQVWTEADIDVWQVMEIEGVAKPENLQPYICEVSDGKGDKEIYESLLTDPKIMARPDVVSAITSRQLLQTYQDAGFLTRDSEGVFHRAVGVAN